MGLNDKRLMASLGQRPIQNDGRHRLVVNVVGGFSAFYLGQPVIIRGRKARALLAYVVFHAGQAQSREKLVGLLWSETDEEHARASLRQCLRELRKAFDAAGYSEFGSERLEVELSANDVQVEIFAVAQDAEQGTLHPLLLSETRLCDKILDGFDDIDPAYRVWLLAFRQSLADRLIRVLEQHMQLSTPSLQQGAQSSKVETLAQALLNLDPTHEVACRHLMRLRTLRGDVAGALRSYKSLWDTLGEDYDIEPTAQTKALLVAIKQGEFDTPDPQLSPDDVKLQTQPDISEMHAETVPPPAFNNPAQNLPMGSAAIGRAAGWSEPEPAPRRPMIVMTPLHVSEVTDAQRDRLICFRHELLACLVRFREWQVSEEQGEAKPQNDIFYGYTEGKGGPYKIEISAYQANAETQLVLTLRDIASAAFIWSERFVLSVENWFDIQREIVRRIGVTLRINLSTERLMRLSRRPSLSVEVYDRWLQGQAFIIGFKSDEWSKAEAIFRELTETAADFSPAFSSLAQLNNIRHLVHPGQWRIPAAELESLKLAQRAAQIDPVDSRAHLCLAWSQALAGQYGLAESSFSSAADLNDSDPWTLISTAHGFAFLGAMERSRVQEIHLLRLVDVPSRSQWAYLVGTRFLLGDYEGCVAAADSAVDVISNLAGWKAAALAHLGRQDEAKAEMSRFIAMIKQNWHGDEPKGQIPDDLSVISWFLHNFPICRRVDWERLRDGVHAAGAPYVPSGELRPVHLATG